MTTFTVFSVQIDTFANKSLVFCQSEWKSLYHVKQKFQDKEGVPIDQQLLSFGNRTMKSNAKLSDYSVNQNSTIILRFNMHGG